ncbi:hypothetical protein M407DRAFT_242141 [Tulasnella calospora MUT 4182]|uniref:Uncharacterized protein n=1 Tax=Tulasnella calospora MUT 4182 TaxID=1051891 RepID=A0A0C3QQ94_9AGAM|nr:hypothetical protein M407DRAFT_242141 [Tulasnella calospora MUT 4182]
MYENLSRPYNASNAQLPGFRTSTVGHLSRSTKQPPEEHLPDSPIHSSAKKRRENVQVLLLLARMMQFVIFRVPSILLDDSIPPVA